MTLPFDLGTLRIETPAILFALLALPLLFRGVAGRGRAAAVAGVCRAGAAAAVVLALAGLEVEHARPADGVCVVAAIDVSSSVGRAGVEAARRHLEPLVGALGERDQLGAVAFAGRARVLAHPAAGHPSLDALLPPPAFDPEALEPGETDLAGALARATPLCPDDHQAAILLFTDGHETTGSLLAEAQLGEPRIPIFPVIPPAPALPPALVRRLLVPPLAPARSALPFTAVVEAREPLSAALQVEANGAALTPLPMDLPQGISVIPLPYRFARPGQYLLTATLLLPPTTPAAPGRVTAVATVTRPLRVLVVSERAAPVVAAALAERGMDVEVLPPAGLAARLGRSADHHLVVLDDVAGGALEPRTLEALERWVAAGGGLVATGGPHLFGDPRLVASPLERLLPVRLQSQTPEPREREPIALYLVIDRSNSMGYATGDTGFPSGEKMEYAKRAALAVLEQLAPSDLVGAIAFDSAPYELGPLLPAAEGRPNLAARIRALQYGGGTDFKEALEIALRQLLETNRRVRHLILLTDGDTNRRADDHALLVGAYARAEISITTIRIGSDTVNLDLLSTISRTTGGEFHHVENVHALPQLMIRDTQRLIDTAANRRERRAHLGDAGPILAGLPETSLPAVARWAVTRPKAGAEVRVYVEAEGRRDPLLATWQYRLGRAAAVPLDFQAQAAGWAAWRGFGKLWAQLALWAASPALPERRLEAVHRPEGTLVRLYAGADDTAPLALRLPGRADVPFRPTGRRRFAALVPNLAPGLHSGHLLAGAREDAVLVPVTRARERPRSARGGGEPGAPRARRGRDRRRG